MRRPVSVVLAGLLVIALAVFLMAFRPSEPIWTEAERRLIASLSLATLPPLPADPSNRVADNPAAAALGKALFFDTRLSSNGKVACASCHLPDRDFQDGIPLAIGVGQTSRRTMPIAGAAYSHWQFWDGRADSQWAQALGPLESAVEHGSDRTALVRLLAAHYRDQYEAIFGPLPDMTRLPVRAGPAASADAVASWQAMSDSERDAVNRGFANIGKAIAAFERTVMPQPGRFDRYADAIAAGREPTGSITKAEIEGLRVFIGKGHCINCHNGPLLSDHYFHNTGVPAAPGDKADAGRAAALAQLVADPFNCLGSYSDAARTDCAELAYLQTDGRELVRAFKTPSLRNVARRAPFLHAGQYGSLDEVVAHYERASPAPLGHSELEPLALSGADKDNLIAFLQSLDDAGADNNRPRMK